VSADHPILSRLETGPPLVLGSDANASLRANGVVLGGPSALGRIVREQPACVADLYHHQIASGVDVLSALTADTLPRSLAQIGMSFRSAALTGCAVDLALDAADASPRPVLVAGVLGTAEVTPPPIERIAEELAMHATRLAAAGCELILTRGFDPSSTDLNLARLSRRAAVASASTTQLPTWSVIELDEQGFTWDGESFEDASRAAIDGGAQAVIAAVPKVETGLSLLQRLIAAGLRAPLGVELAAWRSAKTEGEPMSPDAWVAAAKRLVDAGARIIGGGPGTTEQHVAAFARLFQKGEAQPLWPPVA